MSSDFFKKINTRVPEKNQRQIVEPIIYSDPNPEIIVVSDTYSKAQVSYLKKLLKKEFEREVGIKIIFPYLFNPKGTELTKNIKTFIKSYTIDFTKHIPPHSKILSLGRSLYSFTQESSLQVSAFYDINHSPQKIYHPTTKSWVFPIDDIFKLVNPGEKRFLQNWELFFAGKQIERLREFRVPNYRIPQIKRHIVENPNEFLSQYIGKEMKVAWDLETTGLLFYRSSVICLTLSFDGKEGFYLDFKDIDLEILSEFFKYKYQIGANLKFDIKFLRNLGVRNLKVNFDTQNAGHCLNEMRSNSLSTHGWLYTMYGGHEIPLQKWKMSHPKLNNYGSIPKEILSDYAILDSCIDYQVYESQLEYLNKEEALCKYYFEEVIPNINMFIDIELQGVNIDWQLLKKIKNNYEEERIEKEKEIFEDLGFEIKLTSKKELGIALEKKLNFPDFGERAKDSIGGYYLTGETQLKRWASMGYKLADRITAHREIVTFRDTFVGSENLENAYWKYRNKEKGTIHPNYKVMLANSHRNKCGSPNLQQVPKRGARAKDFRKIFVPPTEDYLLAEGDFAGLQLRIAAILSQDKNLLEVFSKRGGDLHSVSAINIFHRDMTLEDFMKVKGENPYKTHRSVAKSTNFAFLFGGSAYSFARDVIEPEWTLESCISYLTKKGLFISENPYLDVAMDIREAFFASYPGLESWHQESHMYGENHGEIVSVHGARRLVPQLLYKGKDSLNKEVRELYNITKNSPVQNFESVIILRAMRELDRVIRENKYKTIIFGMIHDAVEFYVHRDEVELMGKLIPEIFEKQYPEYGDVIMEFEMDLSDPLNKKDPTVWGFGKTWK
jgi:DNA polymerase I